MIINLSDRGGNVTSNILTQASWRLYEIIEPLTCFCTTSNFLTNKTIETFQAGNFGDILQLALERNTTDRPDRTDGTDGTDRIRSRHGIKS